MQGIKNYMKITSKIEKHIGCQKFFLVYFRWLSIRSTLIGFFLIIFLIWSTTSYSQSNIQNLVPKQWLSISDGLAHNGVTSIFEDSQGYLWVGTYDGLNRYDGYVIKVFKNTIDKKILVSNRIRTITEDDRGHLWIGTDEGISIYNPDLQNFKNVYSNQLTNQKLTGPIVRKILFSEKHDITICATEGYGVIVLGKDFTYKNQYLLPNEDPNQPIIILDGVELDDTNFLYSTSKGLFLFDYEKKQFTPVLEDKIKYSRAITKTNNNDLIIGLDNGIIDVDYTKENGKYVFQINHLDLKQYRPTSLGLDSLGNLWIGTLINGFLKIDNYKDHQPNQKSKRTFVNKQFDVESGTLRASFVYFSQNSGAWIGTFNKGLYQFDINENPFNHYSTEMDIPNGLSTNRILSISSFENNSALINGNRGSNAYFDTRKQSFEPLKVKLTDSLKEALGKVFIDSKWNIWMNFSNKIGLARLIKGSSILEKIKHPNHSKLDNLIIRSITEDNDGNIWIGAMEGVFKIIIGNDGNVKDIQALNDNSFFKNNRLENVRYVFIDEEYDLVWIGSKTEGLIRVNLKNGIPLQESSIHQFIADKKESNSISSNFVTSIIRIPNGELWIGTERGGICKVLESDGDPKFTTYSEKQGLSNNVVKAIIYNDGNLWIPTNIGLNKFDLKKERFRSYRKEDGLPFEDFEYPTAKLNNGLIIVSGSDGLCYFDPKDINDNESLPPFTFGDFKLFGRNILPNDTVAGRIILKQPLNKTKEIILYNTENVFSVELKSLHYANPENHYFRHQLLPINDNWIEIPSDKFEISYNGLPPDTYTLSVMASNSQNEWTVPKEIKIIIKPPFWKTGWAYFLYSLLLIGIVGLILFTVLRIQSLNHNLVIGKIEKDSIKDLNASKLRFFSNISHEIKTPIALITGPVDLLLGRFKGNQEVLDKLELIKRQSNKINQLVEQVHDFQKANANALKMKKTYFSFDDFVEIMVQDFMLKAKIENKGLEIKKSEEGIHVYGDKKKLEKIFNNLLSNAFKYSQINDEITFDYRKDETNVIVTITDSGRGISKKDLPHIFKRFYQSENNDTKVGGAGIGLAFSKKLVDMHFGFISVTSEEGEGSIFTVRLPIVKEKITEKNLEREKAILLEEDQLPQAGLLNRKVELTDLKLDDDYSNTHIFLAEDNPELRAFISEVLLMFFKVTTFSNGKKCLDAMKTEWPDLLVSDVLMPEMNGFELSRRIKSDIRTSHIPILLLTACTSIEEQIEGLEVGADNYVKKPFDIQHLVMNIVALLKSRKQLRERFQIDSPMVLVKNQQNENDSLFLEKLYEIMNTNLDNQDLEMDSFAKELYLNRTHFYQKVKALTDQTPYELMKEFRLKKAAELLVQKKLSVSEVYYMTGFKSRTHFSKLFKEKYNVTPGKYGKH